MVDEIEPDSSPGGDRGIRGSWARIPAGAQLVIPIALLLAVVVVSFYNWVRPEHDDWSRLPSRLVCQVQSGLVPPPSVTVASVDVAHPHGNVLQLAVHFAQALPPPPGDQLTYSLANNGSPFAVLNTQQGSNDLAIRNVRTTGGADVRSGKSTNATRTLPDTVEMVLDLTKFGIEKELISPTLTVTSQGNAMQVCHG
ncbi:hypothetical protein [Mycobacterium rhizamassiliense]|uniref:hypothetical protein n=1 Tax=Mycobacterium rhizamassiliense TaxID=1841860 RepID=UPI00097CFC6A|nr:hypothetical protein [Mycobacterium rhizamassiliense]